MLAIMALSSFAALLFIYLFMPSLWASIMAVDDSLDCHESGVALVASRMIHFQSLKREPYQLTRVLEPPGNPFRETGPPANMAKLILLRHKVRHSFYLLQTG